MGESKLAILEGLLFAAGEEGMHKKQLSEILEIRENEVEELLEDWKEELQNPGRGIRLMESRGTYSLTTKPEYAAVYKRWGYKKNHTRLSQASLESLAIIAYRQPITRVEVDYIRGVKSDQALQTLAERQLVEEAGRKETVGRPILYRTTEHFLTYFGLQSLEDLPELKEAFQEDYSAAENFFDSLEEG
ncbi:MULTISPECIES: SMC-Scp complex subunit ScpB [Salimicrobium]|uniref:Segregation and condensation protein B n=1 Tax=Salimicrobium humidisoli TaxID=2029857 RepID=A0ABX4HQM0_9BACI|nr:MULTISPECIES: SMC-Scp complex subunit ScpB [Salimicrobium]PBB05496.1 SMC-Scp complex subunit ScpB [Salimicrobium humidisoli]